MRTFLILVIICTSAHGQQKKMDINTVQIRRWANYLSKRAPVAVPSAPRPAAFRATTGR